MSGDQIANLAYLGLLGTVIAVMFFVSNSERIGKKLQQAATWALIFIGTIAAAGLWSDIRSQNGFAPPQGVVVAEGVYEVPRRADGHFHLTAQVNGTPVDFIVDTGATDIVLTLEDAARVGIEVEELAFLGRARTANGTVGIARVRLDEVRLGDMRDTAVPASVNEAEMFGSLLGMSYLSRFARIEIAGDTLILTR